MRDGAERDEGFSFPGLSGFSRLGAGGMGTVFRAWQDDLGRAVAVKTLRAELVERAALREQFAREAHILAQLDHQGIVPVHYAGETESGPYYVMRLVEGESVDRHLDGAPPSEVASVFRSIADALAAAHREGVLHRDVKPENVLVEASGRPILVDFGLSTQTLVGEVGSAEEGIVGTPDYLAPELLAGTGGSVASDVYALGATLYQALTGSAPFPVEDLGEKLRAIREEDPPLPRALRPEVPKPLQAICLKAMERSPADRYPSAEEMRRDLDRYLAGDPVQTQPERSRSLLLRKIGRHLEDCAEWEEQGLIDERQRAALQYSYEHLDEQQRGLLRGVLGSLPDLLLLAGMLVIVFGPVLLQVIAWNELGSFGRLALPTAPLLLLLALGAQRWRRLDRKRGVACLLGAALLAIPSAFALTDLVPALRAVTDAQGVLHPVVPGRLWLPGEGEPAWVHAGARLLDWKLLGAAALALGMTAWLYRRTRAAAFLWILCFAAAGAILPAAQLAGWRELPLGVRWVLANLGALGAIACGLPLDRAWRRDRAAPFYGLGFLWLVVSAMVYAGEGLPLTLIGLGNELEQEAGSVALHGLGIVTAGLIAHRRGTALLQRMTGAPLLLGFLFVLGGLSGLSGEGGTVWEVLLVASSVAFLLTGLVLHRNSLVLPAAIALPVTVGSVSQRHVDALWAWSAAVVIGGAALVLLGFRLSALRSAPATRPARSDSRP